MEFGFKSHLTGTLVRAMKREWFTALNASFTRS